MKQPFEAKRLKWYYQTSSIL